MKLSGMTYLIDLSKIVWIVINAGESVIRYLNLLYFSKAVQALYSESSRLLTKFLKDQEEGKIQNNV